MCTCMAIVVGRQSDDFPPRDKHGVREQGGGLKSGDAPGRRKMKMLGWGLKVNYLLLIRHLKELSITHHHLSVT